MEKEAYHADLALGGCGVEGGLAVIVFSVCVRAVVDVEAE
jgi:hypothetical protein